METLELQHITSAAVDTINATRSLLGEMFKELRHDDTWNGGVCADRCAVASDALFDVLNHLHAYLDEDLTDAQIHNRA